MTIIDASHYLEQLLSPAELDRIADCQSIPFGCRSFHSIPFHSIPFHSIPFHPSIPFKQVLLQDGTSFAVHKSLAEVFPGRFKTISPAAIECHMLMSLLEQSPVCMQVSADTASERQFLPEPERLNNSLLLADAGYIDMAYFAKLNEAGGFYLVRGSKSLNPKIIRAWRGDEQEVPKLAGLSLKDAGRRHCRAEVLDMVVKSGKVEYRLIDAGLPGRNGSVSG